MKCIVYAIKLNESFASDTVLGNYSEATSRHGLGGQLNSILASANRFLVHVLEGKESEVDVLYKNIVNNDKSGKVIELINTPVKARSFAKHAPVVPSTALRKELALFLHRNQEIFSGLCSLKKSVLLDFGVLKKKIKERTISITNSVRKKSKSKKARLKNKVQKPVLTSFQEAKYKGKYLSLSGWVNIETKNTNADDELLGLSLRAKLLYGSHLFEDLVSAGSFGTKQQIIEILEECESLGGLEVEESAGECTAEGVDQASIRKSKFGTQFYKKLNKWLK